MIVYASVKEAIIDELDVPDLHGYSMKIPYFDILLVKR